MIGVNVARANQTHKETIATSTKIVDQLIFRHRFPFRSKKTGGLS